MEQSFKHNMKTPVSVKKTKVSVIFDSNHNSGAEEMMADPDKQCPLHNKLHPYNVSQFQEPTGLQQRTMSAGRYVCLQFIWWKRRLSLFINALRTFIDIHCLQGCSKALSFLLRN